MRSGVAKVNARRGTRRPRWRTLCSRFKNRMNMKLTKFHSMETSTRRETRTGTPRLIYNNDLNMQTKTKNNSNRTQLRFSQRFPFQVQQIKFVFHPTTQNFKCMFANSGSKTVKKTKTICINHKVNKSQTVIIRFTTAVR